MMLTTSTIIRRSGLSALLFACSLWTPSPILADPGGADLSNVRAAAEQGSIRDEIALAGDYFTGTGVPQDSKMAAYWYEKAAGLGNPEAQNQIGYFYQAGIGVARDPKRAVRWYQLAAAAGFPTARVNLAIAYLRGLGISQNDELAVQLLKQAFDAGNGTAATYLGMLYYFGIAVKQDKAIAERWFESGLKLHDPLAAFDLGSFYSVQADHPHDLPKAAEFLSLAADAGYVPAMHSLGLLLINHPELKHSPEQSRTLLETAANAGSWKSSVVLGILARDGRGTPVDDKAAYFYFRAAVLQGGKEAEPLARSDLKKLEAKLGPEELEAATASADAWFKHHSITLAFVYKEGTPKHDFPAAAVAYASDGSSAGQLVPLGSS
jgi:hypothetical protein